MGFLLGKWIDVRSSTLNKREIPAIRLKTGVFAILQAKNKNLLQKCKRSWRNFPS